jgi:hypothetical protein
LPVPIAADAWQNSHPVCTEPHRYGSTTGTAPVPSLWHAFAPHDPNAVGYVPVYPNVTDPPTVNDPSMCPALGCVPGVPHAIAGADA